MLPDPAQYPRLGVKEATFQLGYRGMIDLATPQPGSISAEDVCEGDELDYSLGSHRHLFRQADPGRPRFRVCVPAR